MIAQLSEANDALTQWSCKGSAKYANNKVAMSLNFLESVETYVAFYL